jgi:hypothetical protein
MPRAVGVLALLLSLTVHVVYAATTDQLRAAIAADAQATQGRQYIHFGPMRDGRDLYITTQIVNGSSDVDIAQTGKNNFLIRMGRMLPLDAIFVSDAMLICARFPQKACDRMAAYIETVRTSKTISEKRFLEEVYPNLKEAAQITRADDAVYRSGLMSGLQSLTMMVTLHEIGHAALHHLDDNSPDQAAQIEQEGEADGFAAQVAATGNQSPAGAGIAFLLYADEEVGAGKSPVFHPPAICRAMAMTSQSINWLRQNQTDLLARGNDKARDQLAEQMFDQLMSGNAPAELDPAKISICKAYLGSLAVGMEKGKRLVDKNTKIDSTVPGQH